MVYEVKVTRMDCPKADWIRVVNAARRTWGKQPINHEPSDKFKKEILRKHIDKLS